MPPRSDCFSKHTISGTFAPARRAASNARSWASPLGPAPRMAMRWVMLGSLLWCLGVPTDGHARKPAAAGRTRLIDWKHASEHPTGAWLRSCRYRAWRVHAEQHCQAAMRERNFTEKSEER